MRTWIFLLAMVLAWPAQAAWIRADEATGEIYEVWREELYAKTGEVSVDVGNVKFTARTHRWDGAALRLATADEIAAWDAKFNPSDAEIIDQTWADNPLIRAMILRDAKRGGKTVQQILDELKAELP